jgi:hypothetical protein
MYTNAQYLLHHLTKQNSSIKVEINGIQSIVPLDPRNTDYREICRLVEAGELIIAEADQLIDI